MLTETHAYDEALGYTCSLCRNPEPHESTVAALADYDKKKPAMRVLFHRLAARPKTELEQCYRNECFLGNEVKLPNTYNRRTLVRALMFRRHGVEWDEDPLPLSPLHYFHYPPPANTVARQLYDDMLALDQQYPQRGLGLEPRPNSAEKDGLTPHVMQHLESAWRWHRDSPWLGASHCRHRFAQRLVRAIHHWQGVHEYPQCKRDECVNVGVLVPEYAVAREVKRVLKRCARQYSDDKTSDPDDTPFDHELDDEVPLDWYRKIANYV